MKRSLAKKFFGYIKLSFYLVIVVPILSVFFSSVDDSDEIISDDGLTLIPKAHADIRQRGDGDTGDGDTGDGDTGDGDTGDGDTGDGDTGDGDTGDGDTGDGDGFVPEEVVCPNGATFTRNYTRSGTPTGTWTRYGKGGSVSTVTDSYVAAARASNTAAGRVRAPVSSGSPNGDDGISNSSVRGDTSSTGDDGITTKAKDPVGANKVSGSVTGDTGDTGSKSNSPVKTGGQKVSGSVGDDSFGGGGDIGDDSGCFTIGTKITLSSGNLINIEDIKSGMVVTGQGGQVYTVANLLIHDGVNGFIHNFITEPLINVLFNNDQVLETVGGHPVYLNNGDGLGWVWSNMFALEPGYKVKTSTGEAEVTSITVDTQATPVLYNLELLVEPGKERSYYANGVLVRDTQFIDLPIHPWINANQMRKLQNEAVY